MAETLSLYFRAGAELHRLPVEFTAPGDVAGMKFSNLARNVAEFSQLPSRAVALRIPLSRLALVGMPVLEGQKLSQKPIQMSLCNNEVLPTIFQFRSVHGIENLGTHFMVEISGVNAG